MGKGSIRSWRRRVGQAFYAIELEAEYVGLFEERSPHQAGGLNYVHELFLAGRYPPVFDEAFGEAIGEVKQAIRELRESPEGRRYAEIVGRWEAIPMDPRLKEICAHPDPWGFAIPASVSSRITLAIGDRSLFEAEGIRAHLLFGDGERTTELPAPVRAGLVVGARYWLVTDRLHVFGAKGDVLFDESTFADRYGLPGRIELGGLYRRGDDVAVEYTCRIRGARLGAPPLERTVGTRGLVRVDVTLGEIVARHALK